MNDLISRQALCEYALNQKDKSVTPNDIMRFPSAQPEPCEDAVSRKVIMRHYDSGEYKHVNHISRNGLLDYIEQLPPAQPEKHTQERTETHACDCISRQDAIDAHYEYCNKHPDAGFPVWSLKILENLPSAQPDLSGYSDKLWKAAYERGKAEAQPDLEEAYICGETEAEARYHAERKKGKWIYGESEAGNDGYYCSKCGNFVPWKYDEYDIDFIKEFLFCNKCGAEMEGQDE